jgi:hypothetical protein
MYVEGEVINTNKFISGAESVEMSKLRLHFCSINERLKTE